MAQNGKLMPNLDQQSTKVLNLTVLQRIDPFVEEILMTAAHVTFYEFNIELSQWSRKDVEGSLFVVKRNTQPRFQFIVMNRRNTAIVNYTALDEQGKIPAIANLCLVHLCLHDGDNLVEDLLGDFEYDVQVPYLLYRNAAQEVNGIWFYNAHDCEAVGNLFSRILNAYSKVPPKPKVSSTKSSEFEELEAVPTPSVVEGPLEPPASSAVTSVPDVADDSFMNFFSGGLNIGNASNSGVTGQPNQPSAIVSLPSLAPAVAPLPVPTPQPSHAQPSSLSHRPTLDTLDSSSISSSNCATNLVKPSFFAMPSSAALMMPPVLASIPTAPPLQPPVTMQRPYGTPLLQPFPPPTPPPSLTPAPNYGPVITREKVRDALLKLMQNSQFIDMVYREMLNAHNL